MRIAELSRRSGVSVPTIKYYLREGLLPGGTTTGSPNQAAYDETHLRRLKLIRVFIDVGGLSVAATRDGYADAAEAVARHDLGTVAARMAAVPPGDPQRRAAMVGAVVLGTVLGEAMLSALRRLAQEDASARMLHAVQPGPGSADGAAGAGPQRA